MRSGTRGALPRLRGRGKQGRIVDILFKVVKVAPIVWRSRCELRLGEMFARPTLLQVLESAVTERREREIVCSVNPLLNTAPQAGQRSTFLIASTRSGHRQILSAQIQG